MRQRAPRQVFRACVHARILIATRRKSLFCKQKRFAVLGQLVLLDMFTPASRFFFRHEIKTLQFCEECIRLF